MLWQFGFLFVPLAISLKVLSFLRPDGGKRQAERGNLKEKQVFFWYFAHLFVPLHPISRGARCCGLR